MSEMQRQEVNYRVLNMSKKDRQRIESLEFKSIDGTP